MKKLCVRQEMYYNENERADLRNLLPFAAPILSSARKVERYSARLPARCRHAEPYVRHLDPTPAV